MQDLIELEEQGWLALSSEGEASKKFYSAALENFQEFHREDDDSIPDEFRPTAPHGLSGEIRSEESARHPLLW